ncbi:MAG: putative transcriptional regulator [Sphingobacteriales bacterium]|nr:putative transcriptional regulator [Sphingobacteriales bacterium]
MKRFSISDIETLTGIKAHTLRIWEQRYNFFTSKRSETNIRYYDAEDLRLLLNIATLNQNGYKISKISKMQSAEIDEQVNRLVQDQFNFGVQVQILSNAVLRLDEYDFQGKLKLCIEEMGFKNAMQDVVFPFLRKVEFMRQVKTLTVCHEQFAIHHVCNKITTEIAKISFVKALNGNQYLLFLPYAEENEVSLLYLKYLIKEKGNEILYLGAHVSLKDLAIAISIYQPDYAISIFTKTRATEEINTIIHKILETKPNLTLLLIGTKLSDKAIVPHDNLKILDDITEFVSLFGAGEISLAS